MSEIDPKDYVVRPGTGIEDVDLDETEVRTPDGERLTDERAEKIAGRVLAGPGRPSLTGAGKHSPQIAVRVPADVRDRLRARAAREGKSLSQVAREALERAAG